MNFAPAIRFWADQFESAYANYIRNVDSAEFQDNYATNVRPTINGAKIVMLIALLDRIIVDSGNTHGKKLTLSNIQGWKGSLGLTNSWTQDNWDILENFVKLRHCFAHEFGRLTPDQDESVKNFLNRLENKGIKLTRKKKSNDNNLESFKETLESYYSIDGYNNITLDSKASVILRHLINDLLDLLVENGVQVQHWSRIIQN